MGHQYQHCNKEDVKQQRNVRIQILKYSSSLSKHELM